MSHTTSVWNDVNKQYVRENVILISILKGYSAFSCLWLDYSTYDPFKYLIDGLPYPFIYAN